MQDAISSQALTNVLMIVLVCVFTLRWLDPSGRLFYFLHFFFIKNGRWWSWMLVCVLWLWAIELFQLFLKSLELNKGLDNLVFEKYGETKLAGAFIGLGFPVMMLIPLLTYYRVRNIIARWRSGCD